MIVSKSLLTPIFIFFVLRRPTEELPPAPSNNLNELIPSFVITVIYNYISVAHIAEELSISPTKFNIVILIAR